MAHSTTFLTLPTQIGAVKLGEIDLWLSTYKNTVSQLQNDLHANHTRSHKPHRHRLFKEYKTKLHKLTSKIRFSHKKHVQRNTNTVAEIGPVVGLQTWPRQVLQQILTPPEELYVLAVIDCETESFSSLRSIASFQRLPSPFDCQLLQHK
jgi:hypothetical protein